MPANSDWDLEDPTPQKSERLDYPERTLWAAVITLALRDASAGDAFAARWFQEPSGTFVRLCGQLDLPVPVIRDQMKRMHGRDGRRLGSLTHKGQRV
jgi:hypothetical protein